MGMNSTTSGSVELLTRITSTLTGSAGFRRDVGKVEVGRPPA